MTKMKSKKMNKSTFAIVIMAIVMVAMLAFGGTYAYFTANAIGESVDTIKTAQLELRNVGARLTYTATDEIVPAQYVFGAGTLHGEVIWSGADAHDYQTVDLDLGTTNAAVYAFVRVTTMAYSGTDATNAKALMVDLGNSTYAPVLKLIPRLGKSENYQGATGEQVPTLTQGWQEFDTDDNVGVSNSTSVFYFKVDDNEMSTDGQTVTKDYRAEFNALDFDFCLQFHSGVMADRRQFATAEDATKAGYTLPIATVEAKDGKPGYVIYEKTNVYQEKEGATGLGQVDGDPVQIMNCNIVFEMQFVTIQQLGFNNAADAYRAAVAEFGKGGYTDDDLVPSTPDTEDDKFKPETT